MVVSDPDISGPPAGIVEVPDLVREHAGRESLVAVWLNQADGLTFRGADRFLKWNPPGSPLDLTAERDRLLWAAARHPVPEVLEFAADERGQLLITRALPGLSAVDARWLAEPDTAVRAIGEGLRALHEDLAVAECPFGWEPEIPATVPAVDRVVVCHGDPCAPNTLVGDDGRWTGHVDLGRLGTGDRWVDLAVGSMSLDWNYGPGFQDEYFAAYGVARDEERISFYRTLWNASE